MERDGLSRKKEGFGETKSRRPSWAAALPYTSCRISALAELRRAAGGLEAVFLSSLYGDHEEGKPVKVLAAFPLAEDVTESLGEYESEARAMEVLEEIADEYGKYLRADGGLLATANFYAPPFAFAPPKIYKMPLE